MKHEHLIIGGGAVGSTVALGVLRKSDNVAVVEPSEHLGGAFRSKLPIWVHARPGAVELFKDFTLGTEKIRVDWDESVSSERTRKYIRKSRGVDWEEYDSEERGAFMNNGGGSFIALQIDVNAMTKHIRENCHIYRGRAFPTLHHKSVLQFHGSSIPVESQFIHLTTPQNLLMKHMEGIANYACASYQARDTFYDLWESTINLPNHMRYLASTNLRPHRMTMKKNWVIVEGRRPFSSGAKTSQERYGRAIRDCLPVHQIGDLELYSGNSLIKNHYILPDSMFGKARKDVLYEHLRQHAVLLWGRQALWKHGERIDDVARHVLRWVHTQEMRL